MNKPISQRLAEYLYQKKIDGPSIYKETAITTDEWSKFIKLKRGLPEHDMVTIVSKLDKINTRWLITGEGTMSIDEKNVAAEPASPNYTNLKIEELNIQIAELKQELTIARRDNSRLIKLLSEKQRGGNFQGELEGGVEKPGKTG